MADLQQQLNAILSDPQAMGQITAIAQALSGAAASPEPQGSEAPFVPIQPDRDAAPSTPDVSALLGGQGLPGIDPALIQLALRLLSEYNADTDRKTALLTALRPFLSEERLETLEKAERAARLTRVIRSALQAVKEGELHV